MPISQDFKDRLFPNIEKIADCFETPFHIYDEKGIIDTCNRLKQAFSGIKEFKEYFAVKALPNPEILRIFKDQGFGFDCSSIPELILARKYTNDFYDIIFSSNNTTKEEFDFAMAESGSIINIDDISLIDTLTSAPELIAFRFNPGPERTGNAIIGNPIEAKYGITRDQVIPAYKKAVDLGAKEFGLHAMVASNELKEDYIIETARMLLDLADNTGNELGIKFRFVSLGGGIGIPYKPEDRPMDIERMGIEITKLVDAFEAKNGYQPAIHMESGRFMTGPHGVLATKMINRKSIYREYIGVDASMPSLMRPGIYDAYHHIEIPGKEDESLEKEVVDVAGSLCENTDKFAIQRKLPVAEKGDILIIQDTGAHGHAMGFTYNGRLRPKELLLTEDGKVKLIRREERNEDYFATLDFEEKNISL